MKTGLYHTIINYVFVCLLVRFMLQFTTLPIAAQANGPDIARIDAFVQAQMQASNIPGLALGIVHGDQIVHLRGFGRADQTGRGVTAQTPFVLGSVTKSFTALAILQLVEAGKIELDAPVQRYLPWFRVTDPVASTQITIRNLLNQTGGLPTSAGVLNTTGTHLTLEQYVHDLNMVTLASPIGSTFHYSNANYSILGLLIQTVSGQSYGAYIQQHIFAPLQMQHSFVSEQDAKRDGLAQGYTWQFGIPTSIENYDLQPAILPDGGLISTAEDMSHYLIAHMNEGQYGKMALLSPGGITTLHAPVGDTQGFQGANTFYGMGWFNGPVDGVPAIYHDGDTAAFHSYMLIEPQSRWGVVLLMNVWGAAGTFTAFPQIQLGILHLLMGHEPAGGGLSVNIFYLVVDSILAIISGLVLWSMLRLPRWYSHFRQSQQNRRRLIRGGLPLIWELTLPALSLLGIPLLSGFSWMILMRTDITLWLLLVLTILLLIGIIRAVLRIFVLSQKPVTHHLHQYKDSLHAQGVQRR